MSSEETSSGPAIGIQRESAPALQLPLHTKLMDAAMPQVKPKVIAPLMTSPRRGRCTWVSCAGR